MFAERLKKERNKKDISQKELSKIIGVSQQTVGSWEVGRTQPDHGAVLELAEYFGVSSDYLLGRVNERTSLVDEALKDDPELQAFWDTMKEREDLQLMFKKSKALSPDAIKQIIGIIKLIEDKENEEFGV